VTLYLGDCTSDSPPLCQKQCHACNPSDYLGGGTVLSSETQTGVGTWSGSIYSTCDGNGDALISGSATWTPSGVLAAQFSGQSSQGVGRWCSDPDDIFSGAPDQEYGATSYTVTWTELYIAAVSESDPTPAGPWIEAICLFSGHAFRFTYVFNADGSIDVTIDEMELPPATSGGAPW
jgi:hypothetical protein